MNLPKRIAATFLIWVVLSLVLVSAWGWDQVRSFAGEWPRAFLLPAWLALSLYGASCDTRTSSSGGKKEIRRHRQILWVIFPLLLVWFVYLPCADRYGIGTLSIRAVRETGLVLFAISLLIRIEAIRAQGKQFSMHVALQEGHKLTTSGPYCLVRHPAYLGVIGMVLGISLVFANMTVGLMMTAINWLWLSARIRDEENLLLDEFGEEYAIYCNRTRKIVPFVY